VKQQHRRGKAYGLVGSQGNELGNPLLPRDILAPTSEKKQELGELVFENFYVCVDRVLFRVRGETNSVLDIITTLVNNVNPLAVLLVPNIIVASLQLLDGDTLQDMEGALGRTSYLLSIGSFLVVVHGVQGWSVVSPRFELGKRNVVLGNGLVTESKVWEMLRGQKTDIVLGPGA
jgi:hypothetical protein